MQASDLTARPGWEVMPTDKSYADLIAGVAMSIEGAFKIGEWIRLADGTEGEVIDIDWFS